MEAGTKDGIQIVSYPLFQHLVVILGCKKNARVGNALDSIIYIWVVTRSIENMGYQLEENIVKCSVIYHLSVPFGWFY